MWKAILFALTVTGVGAGIYLLPQGNDANKSAVLPPAASLPMQAPKSDQSRVFSADKPLQSAGVETPKSALGVVAADLPRAEPPRSLTNTATVVPAPVTSFVAPTQLTQPTPVPLTTEAPSRRLSSSRPADEDARRELVKDLQRELKRVGCYEGDLTGTWSATTKKAMASFTDRVNATLPLEEPDYILLTLVQGHTAQACGKGCPTGQGLNDGGKCVPSAILAQSAKRSSDSKSALAPLEVPAPTVAERPARTPQGKKQPEPSATVSSKTGSSSWSTVVTAAPQAPALPLRDTTTSVAAAPPSVLPGRMAMGAPVEPPRPQAASEADRTKAELLRRKAELTAAADAQRNAEADSEAERKTRIAEAQARKIAAREQAAKEKLAQAKAAAIEAESRKEKTQEKLKTAAVAQEQPAPAAAPSTNESATALADNSAIAAAARQAILKKTDGFVSEKRVKEASAPIVQPQQRRQVALVTRAPGPVQAPLPRYIPPYALGAQAAPRSNTFTAVQPRTWTRTIFNDISRMR
jgi:hypothetical protein